VDFHLRAAVSPGRRRLSSGLMRLGLTASPAEDRAMTEASGGPLKLVRATKSG
jgi:hypothetical protein